LVYKSLEQYIHLRITFNIVAIEEQSTIAWSLLLSSFVNVGVDAGDVGVDAGDADVVAIAVAVVIRHHPQW
jgi:hypothetical protein